MSQLTVWRDVRNNWTAPGVTETPDDFGRCYRRMRLKVAELGGNEQTLADFDAVWPDLGSPHGVAKTIGRGDATLTVSLQYLPGD